jgi:glycosyltransferase involved in cell wall biosynthesis
MTSRTNQLTQAEPQSTTGTSTVLPIAVMVTAHGPARFLSEALASVRAQTAAPAEIIVLDDTSPDAEAPRRAEAAGASVVRHPLGPNIARNVAILETRQEWIAFIVTDDEWMPHKLETQWRAVQACPGIGAVFSNYWEVSAKRGTTRPYLEQMVHYWGVERHEVAPGIKECEPRSLARQFVMQNFVQRSTLLVRRDLLVQVGLFDRDLTHLEDRDCWLRLLSVARFAVLEEPLMWSRLDEQDDPTRGQWGYQEALDALRLRELIAAHPREYPAEAVQRYVADGWRLCLAAGWLADRHGFPRHARRHYLRSWWLGGGMRPLVLAAMPSAVRRGTRTLSARIGGIVNEYRRRGRHDDDRAPLPPA